MRVSQPPQADDRTAALRRRGAALDENAAPRRTVVAWSLYDFGGTAFNTVMISFVFSVYLTGVVARDKAHGELVWTNAQTLAGVLLAVLAPLMGAWGDRVRRRRRMLSVSTLLVVACMLGCFLVAPREPYLWLGAALLATGSLCQDIAGVFYNGMLPQVSTPRTVGRISGTAWALGYLGGLFALVFVLFGFVLHGGFLHLPTAGSLNIRAVSLYCALQVLVFALPIMVLGPDGEPRDGGRFSVVGAYRDIGRRLAHMWREERGLLHFLVASAIYRDGLTTVFSFAGVIAAASYGFSSTQVIYLGLGASVSASIGTWLLGRADDRVGPRPVVLGSLLWIVGWGVAVVLVNGAGFYWVAAMAIALVVGGVQSASRSLLTRLIPAGEENETFGLYTTVGRAAAFIAPSLIGVFTAALGTRWSILGIITTLLIGLVVFWPLRIEGVTHDHVRR